MDRDFDMEKVIDKMRELRDKRDLELLNQDMEDVNLNSDYQKELPQNEVLNVKYLGTIEIDGEKKGIYLLIEQKEEKDGRLAEIEKYYTEDGEFLGADSNLDQFEFITLNEEYLNKEGLLEKIENINKEGILDLNNIENERLEELARELGIDVKDIEKYVEIDAEKEIDKYHEELTNEQIEELQEEGIEPGDEEYRRYLLDHGLSLPKEEVEEVTSTKAEIKTNQKVTDSETMASMLGVQGKGYTKIAVIYSDKLQKNDNTTEFSFVGIKSDGSAELIDSLEQAYGNNPTKNVQTMNRDGSKIEEDKVNSIYTLKGKREGQLAVDKGKNGIIKVSYVRTPRQANQEAVSIPIETQTIRSTTREVREYMNESKNCNVDDNINRIKEHRKAGCKEIDVRNTDDNPYNDTHEHIQIDENYMDYCVTEILKNDEISSIYNREDVKNRIRSAIRENENLNTNYLIKNIEAQMINEAKREHQRPENNI